MLKDIINALLKLNEIDEYIDGLGEKLSSYDSSLSDLYHVLENNNLNIVQSYKFVKEMQDNRNMLITELNKTNNRLHKDYNNRIYTDEELIKIGIKKQQ